MDCTGEARRIQICNDYNITAVGCIVIYDGRTEISDAGGQPITDKYYQFKCVHKVTGKCESIKCGFPTAKHICDLCNIELPSTFNPFANEGAGGGAGGVVGVQWNRARRQLHNAIMLFITTHPNVLEQGKALFNIKEEVEIDVAAPINNANVKGINTVFEKFDTSITEIIQLLQSNGEIVRNFEFDELTDILQVHYGITNSRFS